MGNRLEETMARLQLGNGRDHGKATIGQWERPWQGYNWAMGETMARLQLVHESSNDFLEQTHQSSPARMFKAKVRTRPDKTRTRPLGAVCLRPSAVEKPGKILSPHLLGRVQRLQISGIAGDKSTPRRFRTFSQTIPSLTTQVNTNVTTIIHWLRCIRQMTLGRHLTMAFFLDAFFCNFLHNGYNACFFSHFPSP
ncbi:hypothetical protein E6O75_ATG07908 [Venturia nashicola]|uniref:Uncharacterized protein n=1 Tax=Venturia nashicola TaxID=86259 RepID=A0A4Z1P4D1_9PEZI|nr:hypothetical protein E6O75_ATG07908 [Venturia nashicola]